MSSSLPFTVQDDLQQKEKYNLQHQQQLARSCSSRRIRLLTIILIVSLSTLGLVLYFGKDISKMSIIGEDDMVLSSPKNTAPADIVQEQEEAAAPLTLKEEILQHINSNQLIVFSKTYCPFSMKAKRILGLYKLNEKLPVMEVDLRDDDHEVKMVLKEISGRETFPNIFLNGQTLGGSDNLEELHESGQLQLLLNESGLV